VYQAALKELIAANDAMLWEYACITSGKILERLLSLRLRLSKPNIDTSTIRGIGQLLNHARKERLLITGDRPRASESSIEATRIIRNSAAHLAFAPHGATEVRATQAMALLACGAETLFPLLSRQPTGSLYAKRLWELLRLDAETPIPDSLLEDLAPICAYAAELSFSRLENLTRILRQHGVDTLTLGGGVPSRFGMIARRAAYMNWRGIQNFCLAMQRLGLSDLVRVFAILQPLDLTFLSFLFNTKSPAECRIYLARSRGSDRKLFRARLSRGKLEDSAIARFWNEVGFKAPRIHAAVEIMRSMPVRTATRIFALADTDALLMYIEGVSLGRSLMLLGVCTDRIAAHDPRCEQTRQAVLTALAERVQGADLSEISPVINAVRKANLAIGAAGRNLVRAVLDRIAVSTREERAVGGASVRRALWDAYAFGEKAHKRAAARLAAEIAAAHKSHSWDSLCLRGLVEFANLPDVPQLTRLSPVEIAEIMVPEFADRWQCYLALVAIAGSAVHHQVGVPENLIAKVPRDEPIGPDIETSRALFNSAMAIIANTPRTTRSD